MENFAEMELVGKFVGNILAMKVFGEVVIYICLNYI